MTDSRLVTSDAQPDAKRMRLRYAGTCRTCAASIAAGQHAVYLRSLKQVECLVCAGPSSSVDQSAPTAWPVADVGTAGASARREYQRRAAKREQRIRTAHPKLGGLILAVTDEPRSTRAWQRGAVGEELLAQRLDRLTIRGVLILHDRRIPGTKANIDHLAVSSAGVFVIDAKQYAGRPRLQIDGGIVRPRTETLRVGSRDCTKLVEGMHKQLALVRAAALPFLDAKAVQGMLCFVEADWPLIGGAFTIDGIDVLWPAKAQDRLLGAGPLDYGHVTAIHHMLAGAFPAA
jgi:hypothetical protein